MQALEFVLGWGATKPITKKLLSISKYIELKTICFSTDNILEAF